MRRRVVSVVVQPRERLVELAPHLRALRLFRALHERCLAFLLKQVADAIVKAVGFTGEYTFDATKADGQFRKPASNKKLLSLMGGFEFTPFEKGAL